MINRYYVLSLFAMLLLLVGCGGDSTPAAAPENGEESGGEVAAVPDLPAGDPEAGETLYTSSCSSCHGPDAKGITGVGKDLTSGEFIPNMSDQDFITFINSGRPTGDPDNTTGIDMPPKGGNPALTDEQILDIVAYLRSIHE